MADIFQFKEFVNSGKGLVARPILPNYNSPAKRADIETITFAVYDLTTGDPPVLGFLDPDDVMFDVVQVWDKDKKGFTFNWSAPGSLWPFAHKYRIVLTFIIINPCPQYPPLAGKQFKLVYQNNAIDEAA